MSEADIRSWLFMGSGLQPILITGSFLAILWLSVSIGSDDWRTTFAKPVLKWYYLSLAIINCYLSVDGIRLAQKLDYSLLCEHISKSASGGSEPIESSSWFSFTSWMSSEPPDKSDSQEIEMLELEVIRNIWIYVMSKVLELVEQIVFALVNYDIEAPIVLHHIAMFGFAWLGLYYYPGGSTFIFIIVSSMYLFISYSFNCLRRFNIMSKPWRNWLKPGIAFLKNVHFALVGCHCATVIFSSPSTCTYPKLNAGVLLGFILVYVFFTNYGDSGGGGSTSNKSNVSRDATPQRSAANVPKLSSNPKVNKDDTDHEPRNSDSESDDDPNGDSADSNGHDDDDTDAK